MDNYYDVQRFKKDDKVSSAATFLKDYAPAVVASLIWVCLKELLIGSHQSTKNCVRV